MKGVNTVLDRLMRKRASNAADFTVTCVAVHDMRLCLLERIVAKMQVLCFIIVALTGCTV